MKREKIKRVAVAIILMVLAIVTVPYCDGDGTAALLMMFLSVVLIINRNE